MSLMLIVGVLFQLIMIAIVIYGFILLTKIDKNLSDQTEYQRKIGKLLEQQNKPD